MLGLTDELSNYRYERILWRMKRVSSPAGWEKRKQILGWILCAKRRLTWKEIQVAQSIDTDERTIEYDNRHLLISI
jgi:hypothetical protein